MVTFWLLIDTIAMIGSPATRGAAPSVVCSGRAWRGAASAGGAAVSAVRAAVAASVTIAAGAHRRTTSVNWAVVHRFVMPCPGCQGGVASKQSPRLAGKWCGSKGAYNRPSCPCHYCTYRGGLLRQSAVDKAKADDQRQAGEHQHHHLHVRKALGGKQRQIVHDTSPKDVPVISRSEPAESSCPNPDKTKGRRTATSTFS